MKNPSSQNAVHVAVREMEINKVNLKNSLTKLSPHSLQKPNGLLLAAVLFGLEHLYRKQLKSKV